MGKWAGGKSNPNMVRLEGIIPAIVSADTWKRVQKRMKDNRKINAANSAKAEYMLSGLIECGQCGGTYTGRTSTNGKGYKTQYYVCGNKYRNHTCDAKNINADEIETAVVAQLKNYLMNSDFEIIADVALRAYESSKKNHAEERKELAALKTKLANGIEAVLSGMKFPELEEEITNIRLRIAELEQIISTVRDRPITREEIVAQLKKDAKNIDSFDIKRLIKSYVTKIYATDNEIIVSGGVHLKSCGRRI